MRTGYFERKNYPFAIPQAIWDGINVTRYSKRTCDACPQKCAYRALRQRLKFTDGIILCNQDLLTAHLINQSHGQEGVLNREIEIAVIDEAHNLEDKVRSATTEHFSKGYLFSRITAAVRELRSEQQSMTSSRITSKVLSERESTFCGSETVVVSNPSFASARWIKLKIAGSSSTAKMCVIMLPPNLKNLLLL